MRENTGRTCVVLWAMKFRAWAAITFFFISIETGSFDCRHIHADGTQRDSHGVMETWRNAESLTFSSCLLSSLSRRFPRISSKDLYCPFMIVRRSLPPSTPCRPLNVLASTGASPGASATLDLTRHIVYQGQRWYVRRSNTSVNQCGRLSWCPSRPQPRLDDVLFTGCFPSGWLTAWMLLARWDCVRSSALDFGGSVTITVFGEELL